VTPAQRSRSHSPAALQRSPAAHLSLSQNGKHSPLKQNSLSLHDVLRHASSWHAPSKQI
jgi:hypothetical protein